MTRHHYRCPLCGQQVSTVGPAVVTCPHGEHDGRRAAVMTEIDNDDRQGEQG